MPLKSSSRWLVEQLRFAFFETPSADLRSLTSITMSFPAGHRVISPYRGYREPSTVALPTKVGERTSFVGRGPYSRP